MSSGLRAIGRSQAQHLTEFRASEEATLLTRLAQTECLLELAKLSGLHIDLGSYAGLVVGTITQYVPSKYCAIALDVPGVPPIAASYGLVPDDFPGEITRPLSTEDGDVGELSVVPEIEDLGPAGFIESITEQVSSSLGTLVEAERLRRQASVANAMNLVDLLSDRPSAEEMSDLADALASLPNALGARIEVAHVALGGAVSVAAGVLAAEPPDLVEVPGGTVGVSVRWAATAERRDFESLQEIVSVLGVALAKADERQRLRDEAETDPLTGIGNRRRAIRALESAITLAEKTEEPIGIVYLDLDYFKAVNDTFGHDVGDRVLMNFARHLAETVRSYDSVNRIGGEEFLIVCPGLDEASGERLASRIVAAVPEACGGNLPEDWMLTASAGVASYPMSAEDPDGLLRAADQALYLAKKSGRNQARMASELVESISDIA